jgi:hypothetical protein
MPVAKQRKIKSRVKTVRKRREKILARLDKYGCDEEDRPGAVKYLLGIKRQDG